MLLLATISTATVNPGKGSLGTTTSAVKVKGQTRTQTDTLGAIPRGVMDQDERRRNLQGILKWSLQQQDEGHRPSGGVVKQMDPEVASA